MCASRIRGKEVFFKEGRIAHDSIERPLCGKAEKIFCLYIDLPCKGTVLHVLPCLPCCLGINLQRRNLCHRKTLGKHEGDKPAACSHIEHTPSSLGRNLCPSAKKHAVSTHLHGTAVVVDSKLFEAEHTRKD